MKLGLQIPYLTWPGGAEGMGKKLAEISTTADDVGFDSLWLMDHYFQIPMVGAAEQDMIEAYTGLSWMAANTKRVSLGTLVTGVTYRHPGILVKQVTTLDVLSGGRAWLGIGAAWFDREHFGLGVPFPPLKERFQRLEEALQIAKQMWSDNNGPYEGTHYNLAETLNVPQALSKPHPRILIGGSGEKKTLKLVAKYANACNIFAGDGAGLKQKLNVLREHCEREGTNYDAIEKTVYFIFSPGANGDNCGQIVQRLGEFSEAGAGAALGSVISVENIEPIEQIGRVVIPQVKGL